jgi:alanine dehydrogenase
LVQPSDNRCFTDEEYRKEGNVLQEDLSSCDILIGVKEVDIPKLIPGKAYLFFSHTAKEQAYNRKLLQTIVEKKITLIDYEYLTKKDRSRVVAFGRWAGIVGTYNGLKAYGDRKNLFELEAAWKLSGLEEMMEKVKGLDFGTTRIVLTGGGRVAHGGLEILNAAGFSEVSHVEFLKASNEGPIYCRLDPWHYTIHKGNREFDFTHFVENPSEYNNAFLPYARLANIYIPCHFWDPESPVLLDKEDLKDENFRLEVIADISCDIDGPIASTVRASTIADPIYGYDPFLEKEILDPYAKEAITVMAVDNLPGELPRDASEDFGAALMENVIPYLLGEDSEGIIKRATIVKEGKLSEIYSYLENFLKGD